MHQSIPTRQLLLAGVARGQYSGDYYHLLPTTHHDVKC